MTRIPNMTSLNHLFDLPGQIYCHVQCGFCTTILLVSVPFTSLSMVVTVRCGHCTSLLSVNLMKASFIPLHLLASLSHLDETGKEEVAATEGVEEEACKVNQEKENSPTTLVTSSDNEDEDVSRVYQVVNKPPEKRQRAPSAYNCFIKEEIRRLEAQNPSMAHKEAFSLAAKNYTTRELLQINVFARKITMRYYHAMLSRTMKKSIMGPERERLRGIPFGENLHLSNNNLAYEFNKKKNDM